MDTARIWEISYAVSKLLAESDNAVEVLPRVLGYLGQETGWDQGNVWRVDYDNVVIRCIVSWHRDGVEASDFERLSQLRTFSIGQGLPGQIWDSHQAHWVEDLWSATNFPRLSVAQRDGLHSGAAFPIQIARRVIGAIEFFSRERREKDPAIIELLTQVCGLLAMFLDRVRAEELLTGAESQFKLLAESSIDAIITIDGSSTILFVNSAVERLFGYTRAELKGQKLMQLIPQRMRSAHEAGIRNFMETGTRRLDWDGVILPARHKDGHEITVEIRFGHFERGGQMLFSGYIREVPAKKP